MASKRRSRRAAKGRREQRDELQDFRQIQPGAAPGTLIIEPDAPAPQLSAYAYGADAIVARDPMTLAELPALLGSAPVVWVNVVGLGDVAVIEELGRIFDLHQLTLKDLVHIQRPKLEIMGDRALVIARAPKLDGGVKTEQISLLVGDGYILTAQTGEQRGLFEPVRVRLVTGAGRIRTMGADYMLYALLDTVIDSTFPLLEELGDELELLEDDILQRPEPDCLHRVHKVRHDLLTLRRAVWPLRDVASQLSRTPVPTITDETRVYLRDCYDNVIRAIDLIETYRELSSSLSDLYLSSVGQRTNEVMGLLTIVATIFIPLTFLAGVYGMNFDRASPWNMPELGWRYGYPAFLVANVVLAALMIYVFRRRGWLGGRAP